MQPSAEDQQRLLVWSVLKDAGLISADRSLPTKRKSEDEAQAGG